MRRLVIIALVGAALVALAVSTGCAGILGIRPPDQKAFPHHAHTTKGVNCRECHENMGSAAESGPLHIPDTAKCLKCHTTPHDSRTCSNCHGLPWVRPNAALAKESLRFEHQKHLPRTKGECVHCHSGVRSDADQIRPAMAVCLGCHQHQDQFSARKCDTCHVDLQGEHVLPTSHVVHEGDWLREHGTRAASAKDLCSTCHSDRQCASCHGVGTVPTLPERMRFDNPLALGVHRAGFRSRHSLEARAQPGLCTTCHDTRSCDACHAENHVRAADNGRSPHPAGWLGLRGEPNEHGRAAWRDPAVCASCHSGQGEQMCVGCHRVGGIGGNPHRPGWTSQKRPRLDQPCRLCHGGP